MNNITFGILSIILLGGSPLAFADTDSKFEFAVTLEETLGHFWALEMNLDEVNSELALIHATHPISELYETMSAHLEANPKFNEKLEQTLLDLKDNASTKVTRNDAQSAIDNAKEIIQEARDIVIGDELSNDSAFKAQLINALLETSKVEYNEAIENGEIIVMAEFQDGSAFIWRSQQIFEEIRSDVKNSGKVDNMYAQIWEAYEQRVTPVQVTLLVDELIIEFESVSRIKSAESSHMEGVSGEGTSMSIELNESLTIESDKQKKETPMSIELNESLTIESDKQKKETSISIELDESLTIETNKEEKSIPISPLKQIKEGIEPENIQCKSTLELIFKLTGEPACVKTSSVQKLVSWGWTQ